jgi:hypothetical protein
MEPTARKAERARHRERIEELIAKTSADPNQQATLIVLSSLNTALEDVADEMVTKENFTTHEIGEIKILTGIKWAWWSATGVGGAVLALAIYIYLNQLAASQDDSRTLRAVAQTQSVMLSRISALEAWRVETEARLELRRSEIELRLRELDARLRSGGK